MRTMVSCGQRRTPESGEPMYDVRVVSGYKTTRERAHAAAQVYGHQLREKSLADAMLVRLARLARQMVRRRGRRWAVW